jgi:phospholipid/cholesterol/gamma-HCH transport system substrate-binding protein
MADPNHANPPFVPSRPENPLPIDPSTGLRGMLLPPEGGQ